MGLPEAEREGWEAEHKEAPSIRPWPVRGALLIASLIGLIVAAEVVGEWLPTEKWFDARLARSVARSLPMLVVVVPLIAFAVMKLLGRAERKALESESRFRSVADATPVMIWETDDRLRANFFNRRWLEFRGRTLPEEQGDGWRTGVHPEDISRFDAALHQAHARRQSFDIEYRLQGADGQYRWVWDQGAPRFSRCGEFLGYIGSTLDVTDHRESRARLQEALAELRDLNAALDEACIVSVADARGRITYVNEQFERISGYSREEVVGQDHRIVNSGHHPRAFWSDMYRTVFSGGAWKSVIRNRSKQGGYYWVASTMKGIFGADGALKKIVSVRTDVTELKALAEELGRARDAAQSADRSKSEFLANMSHEIRTPMTAILGFTDILQEEAAEAHAPASRLRVIADIRRNGEHLLSVINDILDLSKIEAGQLEAQPVASDPVALAFEAVSMLRQRAESKGLAINVQQAGDLPAAMLTDPLRLRQILVNLLGNAIKFTDRGSVTIRVERSGDHSLSYQVIDTGIGIPSSQRDRLFKPFAQADTSHTRRFGGTGLGLTISRRLAGILGGSLDYTSRDGEGTTFELCLPIAASDALASGHTPRPSPVQEPGCGGRGDALPLQGTRVLLAEDGPDNRRIVMHFLSKAGATVEAVEDGQSAVQRAMAARDEGSAFHVILMDVQMPVLDGLSATRLLRSSGYRGPILALTAHAMASDRIACLGAGCDEYMTKPVDRQKLVETCARLSSHGRLRPAV